MTYTEQSFQQGIVGGTPVNAQRAQHIEDGLGVGHDLVEGVMPVGTIVYWPGLTPPAGWLECNGQSLLRASYPGLFAAIGTIYGAVDGTHFNVPDYRGYFLRGLDNGRGIDPGRTIGSAQADDVATHTHHASLEYRVAAINPTNATSGGASIPSIWARQNINTDAMAASEGRPKNIALMFIMKAI